MKKNELIYGIHAVMEVLKARPEDIMQLYLQNGRQDKKIIEMIQLASAAGVKHQYLSTQQLQQLIGDEKRHQGVVARCQELAPWDEKKLIENIESAKKPVILLVLDGVQDPHNLGACLRSANAFGVMAVIAPKDRAASLTDVAKKVSSGASEKTPFIPVSNLHRVLLQLKEAGVWLVGLDASATQSISKVDLKGNIAIVMGGEGEGLRRLTKESCDYLAKIPMRGSVESLNVSVSTGIALYEASRQP